MTSQSEVVHQVRQVSKNLQEEKWALKVALAHNYYMTCMLWREIADFAMKKKIGLTSIITDKYINISDYSIKKLQRCAAHGLIFKHFPLLMLSGVTANQLNEYGSMFFSNITSGSSKPHFWSSVPQHLLDETRKHIQLVFQGFLYKYKFEIADSSLTHQRVLEAVYAFKALRVPYQEIWREMNNAENEKQRDFNQCVRELNIAEQAEPMEVEGKGKEKLDSADDALGADDSDDDFDGYFSEAEASHGVKP
jgi:hypothetical protein